MLHDNNGLSHKDQIVVDLKYQMMSETNHICPKISHQIY